MEVFNVLFVYNFSLHVVISFNFTCINVIKLRKIYGNGTSFVAINVNSNTFGKGNRQERIDLGNSMRAL